MNYTSDSEVHRVQGHISEAKKTLLNIEYDIMIRDLATVITSILSAIPWLGADFVQFNFMTVSLICLGYFIYTNVKVKQAQC